MHTMRSLWPLTTAVLAFFTADRCCGSEWGELFCSTPLPQAYSVWSVNTLFKVYVQGKETSFNIRDLNECGSRAEEMENEAYLAVDRPVIVITHGYVNNELFPWLYEMKDALLQRENCTVLIVVWQQAANTPSYPSAAVNAQTVALVIARMVDAIRNVTTFAGAAGEAYMHCIGHSLGAHVCGQLGRLTKLNRISGLDPAGPGFEECPSKWWWGLNEDCADCVDNIHTDGTEEGLVSQHKYGQFHQGTMLQWGEVDFYPNGGKSQPGCVVGDSVCNHLSVVRYFIHSINSSGCTSIGACNVSALPGSCGNDTQLMGYPSSCHHTSTKLIPGAFYLETTASGNVC